MLCVLFFRTDSTEGVFQNLSGEKKETLQGLLAVACTHCFLFRLVCTLSRHRDYVDSLLIALSSIYRTTSPAFPPRTSAALRVQEKKLREDPFAVACSRVRQTHVMQKFAALLSETPASAAGLRARGAGKN